MAANDQSESGQSVVEFLLTLPLLVGLTLLMIQVSSVIQISIVHQKYVRAQTLFLAMNSPHFPQIAVRNRAAGNSKPSKTNRMILGISNSPLVVETPDDDTIPIAPKLNISSSKKKAEDSGEGGVVTKKRRNVRVWTTASMCSSSYWQNPMDGQTPTSISSVPANISANGFNYCDAPIDKPGGVGQDEDDFSQDETDT